MMSDAPRTPVLPPLLTALQVPHGIDPLAKAIAAAPGGIDAGTVFYSQRDDLMEVALVLAPETPLLTALQMVPVAMVGLGDAIGALAPPEVGVTWTWPNCVEINGAQAGIVRAAASTRHLESVPDWLIIAVTLQFWPLTSEPGSIADYTSLYDEGCGELAVVELVEAWSRHTLVWLNRWEDEGFAPVHASWNGRTGKLGTPLSIAGPDGAIIGEWRGMDEHGQALLRGNVGAGTGAGAGPDESCIAGLDEKGAVQCVPLTTMLDHQAVWPPADLSVTPTEEKP